MSTEEERLTIVNWRGVVLKVEGRKGGSVESSSSGLGSLRGRTRCLVSHRSGYSRSFSVFWSFEDRWL